MDSIGSSADQSIKLASKEQWRTNVASAKRRDCRVPLRRGFGAFISRIKPWHLFLILIVSRIPYLVTLYPGAMLYDSASSIAQFYGITTHTQALSTTPELLYTDHHMLLFTFFMGGFIRMGELLGNQNTGFFLYILLQVIISNLILAYVLNTIRDDVPAPAYLFSLLLYTFLPHISIWQVTMSKDSYFSIFLLLFCVSIYRLVRDGHLQSGDQHTMALLALSAGLCCFTKHQGAYIVAVVALVLFAVYRGRVWKAALSLLLISVFYLVVYSSILLPMLGVSKTGRQEALGLLFQQTARYVVENGDEITDEEAQSIERVLPYERLEALYNLKTQDPVKFEFNQQSTSEDIRAYLCAWTSMLRKHPDTYVRALFDLCGNYFWGFDLNMDYMLSPIQANSIVKENSVFSFHNTSSPEVRNRLYDNLSRLANLPVLHVFFSYPWYTWSLLYFLIALVYRRRVPATVSMVPVFLSLGLLLISPDVEYRYFLPIIYAWPIALGFAFAPERAEATQRKEKISAARIIAATAAILVPFAIVAVVFGGSIDHTIVYSAANIEGDNDGATMFAVETSPDARYLSMYKEDGAYVCCWIANAANSSVEGDRRIWTIGRVFTMPGERTMSFRASRTKYFNNDPLNLSFTVNDNSKVFHVEAGDSNDGKAVVFIVETSTNANYLMMYREDGELVKTWTAGTNNSNTVDGVRIWTVTKTFSVSGKRTMSFRTSMTSTPTDSSVSVQFTAP